MGKDYPKGYDFFRAKTKAAFVKNREVSDPEAIELLITRGEFVLKELEALYMLRKYRTLKQRYYNRNSVHLESDVLSKNKWPQSQMLIRFPHGILGLNQIQQWLLHNQRMWKINLIVKQFGIIERNKCNVVKGKNK